MVLAIHFHPAAVCLSIANGKRHRPVIQMKRSLTGRLLDADDQVITFEFPVKLASGHELRHGPDVHTSWNSGVLPFAARLVVARDVNDAAINASIGMFTELVFSS